MKIVQLTAENVKRLKAVEITPDDTLQVITGRNAQGKTSVLDAIWLALGGRLASRDTTRPIRDGEEKATVTVDLGDLVVTRTWSGDKTTLVVKSADGAKYSSPQTVLDSLVGRLSFDPLEFTRLSARDQLAALLELVDISLDLDALAEDRRRLYDARTEIGRRTKALGQVPPLNEGMPEVEVSASTLIGQIREAQEARGKQARDRDERARREQDVARLETLLEQARQALAQSRDLVQAHEPVPDVAALETELGGIEQTNAAVRRNQQIREQLAEKADLDALYADLTGQISDLDQAKAAALGSAEFPVDGLGFDDDGVTYHGVPFAQASAAEQIRVSLAMAMSLNPRLRVIRILDGSLLDAENMRLIWDMAAQRDYQVWIERVADASGVGVVIEDGAVA